MSPRGYRPGDSSTGGESREHPGGAGERTGGTSRSGGGREVAAQPEFPPEETVPAEAGEMLGPAAAPAPPAPELRFRVVLKEMEQTRPEPEGLVFDFGPDFTEDRVS